jgi:pyruvate formate lyase activating enzyme
VSKCELLSPEKVIEALKLRRNVLEGLVITGGEPAIQPDLLMFIRQVRKIGYKIKLDTNGSCPEVIEALIERDCLDYIAMDIKAPFRKYNKLAGVSVVTEDISNSIDIISASRVVSEFRTTYITELLTETDIEEIRSLVPVGSKYTVQKFIPENAWNWSLTDKNDSKHNQRAFSAYKYKNKTEHVTI